MIWATPALLLGDSIWGEMAKFSIALLVVAPIAIALLALGAWLLSAPSDEARWSESWVRVGTNLGIGIWLVNVLSEAIALWAWFFHDRGIIPAIETDQCIALTLASLVGPGFLLSSLCLALARGMAEKGSTS